MGKSLVTSSRPRPDAVEGRKSTHRKTASSRKKNHLRAPVYKSLFEDFNSPSFEGVSKFRRVLTSEAARLVALTMVFMLSFSPTLVTGASDGSQGVSTNMEVVLPAMNMTPGERLFVESEIELGDFKGLYRVEISEIRDIEITEEVAPDEKPNWEQVDDTLSMSGPVVQVKTALASLTGILAESKMCSSALFTFQPLPEAAEKKEEEEVPEPDKDNNGKGPVDSSGTPEADPTPTSTPEPDPTTEPDPTPTSTPETDKDKENKGKGPEIERKSSAFSFLSFGAEPAWGNSSSNGASDLREIVLSTRVFGCAEIEEMSEGEVPESLLGQLSNSTETGTAMVSGKAMMAMGFTDTSEMEFDNSIKEAGLSPDGRACVSLSAELWKSGDGSGPKDGLGLDIIGAPMKDGKLDYGLQTSISVQGGSYKPGSQVMFYIFSDPTSMGSATVGPDGTFSSDIEIDPNHSLRDSSDHTLRIFGYSANDVLWVLAAPISLAKAPEVVVADRNASGSYEAIADPNLAIIDESNQLSGSVTKEAFGELRVVSGSGSSRVLGVVSASQSIEGSSPDIVAKDQGLESSPVLDLPVLTGLMAIAGFLSFLLTRARSVERSNQARRLK